jgi:hypothetical protein
MILFYKFIRTLESVAGPNLNKNLIISFYKTILTNEPVVG